MDKKVAGFNKSCSYYAPPMAKSRSTQGRRSSDVMCFNKLYGTLRMAVDPCGATSGRAFCISPSFKYAFATCITDLMVSDFDSRS